MGKRGSLVLACLVAGLIAGCSTTKNAGDAGTAGSPDAAKTSETAAPATDTQAPPATTAGSETMGEHAAGTGEHAVLTATNDKGEMVVVGNTVCPISGHEVKPTGYAMMYNGKRVNLCCQDCIEGFEKDPEAAAKKAGVI